ncbi:MAG: UDP-N-acetylmuramate dehydrogenase [Planctomycetaceae bacterium]|nr:UDP-N-acetylmuramate dehydrogenase [Planctomycetaceae bacterium]
MTIDNSVWQEVCRGVRSHVPLAMYTRLQLGGLAEFFVEPESETDLVALLKRCRINKIPVHILGVGSNLLVTDTEVLGLTIRFSNPAFCGIRIDGQQVIAGAGAKLGQVITQSVSCGLGGIEDLIGIPGSVGGSLLGNAGTNSGDLGQWVESVRVANIDGEILTLSKNEISFGYRSSSLDDVIILSTTLRLEADNPIELAKRMQKLWIVRKMQQPGGELASIYVFKNPATGTSAGDLIEQAGLKGTRIGGAVVSERNANFIMVEPNGTVEDVQRLIRLIQEQVEIVTEIRLERSLEVW